MPPTESVADRYAPVVANVRRYGWTILAAVFPLLAYYVAIGNWAVLFAVAATLFAAVHAFVAGIALGGGDTEIALLSGAAAAAIVGGVAILSLPSLSPVLLLAVGTLVCPVAAALGYAAWETSEN
ncbi:hypothetical protein [Haloarchaeobius amylolyticus]|uniref:hypothetical protein n=1 Tax=Haloarchaeobius amylolyticus TaxID=1198296 RepID=UPI0022720D03|nr:hypothetical protein [Haloarchaeobius amylolyticus]